MLSRQKKIFKQHDVYGEIESMEVMLKKMLLTH